MIYSHELVAFLQAWEGLKLVPSGDPLVPGVIDVGYGHVLLAGESVGDDGCITPAEARELLEWDLFNICDDVDDLVCVGLTQPEFDALLSFTYNLGVTAFSQSTLLRKINAEEWSEIPDQFLRWNKASGKVVPGLVKRRAAELAMWNGDYSGRP